MFYYIFIFFSDLSVLTYLLSYSKVLIFSSKMASWFGNMVISITRQSYVIMTSLWRHTTCFKWKSVIITKTSKDISNVIYQFQIKVNTFFTVPIEYIKNDQNIFMSTSSDKSATSSRILWSITSNFKERWKTKF